MFSFKIWAIIFLIIATEMKLAPVFLFVQEEEVAYWLSAWSWLLNYGKKILRSVIKKSGEVSHASFSKSVFKFLLHTSKLGRCLGVVL